MILKDNQIILRSAEQTRKGWDSAFEKMAKEEDDQLIDKEEVELPSKWDKTEWTW